VTNRFLCGGRGGVRAAAEPHAPDRQWGDGVPPHRVGAGPTSLARHPRRLAVVAQVRRVDTASRLPAAATRGRQGC
jgi:hypothetical protein